MKHNLIIYKSIFHGYGLKFHKDVFNYITIIMLTSTPWSLLFFKK
jgi:hypothetical protein